MNERLKHVQNFRWGIERETHRIAPDGSLSEEAHPEALIAPSFTKDFAESQLELVTAPRESIALAVGELARLTEEARGAIDSERLWPFSMPPRLAEGEAIRVARVGAGEEGRIAERYRAGLQARYGIARQLICGVHLNVSFGESFLGELRALAPLSAEEASVGGERDAYYLRLVRNLFGDLPSLVMLFGATPFDANAQADGVRHAHFAYSVRNSPFGYAGGEYRPFLDLGSIDAHIAGIRRGMKTESAAFRKLGLLRDGRPVQLNGRVFQKEKEFYAPIRFKRTPAREGNVHGKDIAPGALSALDSLERFGVEYVELRFFDVDPFAPSGVSEEALTLAHLFVLDALMRTSVRQTGAELTKTLAVADEAALSDPFKTASENGHLSRLLRRLDSLRNLARDVGSDHERALDSYRSRFARAGGSPAAALAQRFLESGLGWNRYGARHAFANAHGGTYGITA
jgi:glutamate--cysteine ligase